MGKNKEQYNPFDTVLFWLDLVSVDSWRRVHTPPLGAKSEGMYPESNTSKEQHTLAACGGDVDYGFEFYESLKDGSRTEGKNGMITNTPERKHKEIE
ncbi:hypothetical protein FACS1894161_2630 [Spirochaetia bacterium]|nr:hypothetical protein FACS1894161_2630 [Spirochaetia bacterium]